MPVNTPVLTMIHYTPFSEKIQGAFPGKIQCEMP